MNVEEILLTIRLFLNQHRQTFYKISTNQSKALELALAVAVAEHYRSHGYEVAVLNPTKQPRHFTVKTSTRGYPWNFSRFILVCDGREFESHMNLMVRGAHDEGIYCVDVGVVTAGSVPRSTPSGDWVCVPNKALVTFAEVKKLVVYPMLLAQFVGIVHEILPWCIQQNRRAPRGFFRDRHLLPTLASLGSFSGNSASIVSAYRSRGIRINIAEDFDMRLASVRGGHRSSPFELDELEFDAI